MKTNTSVGIAILALFLSAGTAWAKPSLTPSVSVPEDADKMIVIKDTTKHVNVFENETVLFKIGDTKFAIKFDGIDHVYDLGSLAPPGVLTHKVTVHVAPNLLEHEQGLP